MHSLWACLLHQGPILRSEWGALQGRRHSFPSMSPLQTSSDGGSSLLRGGRRNMKIADKPQGSSHEFRQQKLQRGRYTHMTDTTSEDHHSLKNKSHNKFRSHKRFLRKHPFLLPSTRLVHSYTTYHGNIKWPLLDARLLLSPAFRLLLLLHPQFLSLPVQPVLELLLPPILVLRLVSLLHFTLVRLFQPIMRRSRG